MTDPIRDALAKATEYLTLHPDEAVYTDSTATAVLGQGLQVSVTGPSGETLVTDMPTSVGGAGSAPSAGWVLRAATASCVVTLAAMRAAQLGHRLGSLEVVVDSISDDRGILGIDPTTPAGPLSSRVLVRLSAPGVEADELRALARWAVDHCPVSDAVRRAIPLTVEVEVG
jgi:uncharacterized OsmC-like protein